MAAAPRGVEAHSLLGGSYPLMTDAVEKVGATLTTRNNRIAQAGFLNRSCAFDARLESILLEDPLKIFFRQYRSKAERLTPSKSSPQFIREQTLLLDACVLFLARIPRCLRLPVPDF